MLCSSADSARVSSGQENSSPVSAGRPANRSSAVADSSSRRPLTGGSSRLAEGERESAEAASGMVVSGDGGGGQCGAGQVLGQFAAAQHGAAADQDVLDTGGPAPGSRGGGDVLDGRGTDRRHRRAQTRH